MLCLATGTALIIGRKTALGCIKMQALGMHTRNAYEYERALRHQLIVLQSITEEVVSGLVPYGSRYLNNAAV